LVDFVLFEEDPVFFVSFPLVELEDLVLFGFVLAADVSCVFVVLFSLGGVVLLALGFCAG
jgi:hypothetical protein